jgi:uncharacterized protein YidB (DUF937 family)
MGLLGQILGGLAGNVLGRSSMGQANTGSGGTSRVLMALLPIVLGMLANRRSPDSVDASGAQSGWGGLGGLLERFRQRGYGEHANSWVGTGPNEPLSPDALSEVFGPTQLSQIASQAGLSEDEARSGLSQLLPEVVDHFTPDGQMPPQDQLLASIDDYANQLGLQSR